MTDPMYSQGGAIPPETLVVQNPAIFANHFFVIGGPAFLRLTLGETVDGKNFAYRASYLIDTGSAKALAKLLTDTIAQVEAATATAVAQAAPAAPAAP